MGLSFFHILVVLIVVLVMFGAGKLPNVMGDLGKGIRAFKDGLKNDEPFSETPRIEQTDKKDPPSPPQA